MTHSNCWFVCMILLLITWLFRSGTCLICIDWFMRVCCDSLIAGRVLLTLNVWEWHILMTHSYVQLVSFICGPHSYVQLVSCMCGPHLYVQHVSFMCGPHSYVQLVSFICATCLIHMCNLSHLYVGLIHMCNLSHSYEGLIHMWTSFICGPHSYVGLIHICNMSHSYVQHVSFICGACLVHKRRVLFRLNVWDMTIRMTESEFEWVIRMCGIRTTHSYVWLSCIVRHDFEWLMCMYDMTSDNAFVCISVFLYLCLCLYSRMAHSYVWHVWHEDSFVYMTFLLRIFRCGTCLSCID